MWENPFLPHRRMRSSSLAVCRAGGPHVPIDTDRTEVPSKKCEGRWDPEGEGEGLRGCDEDGRRQMQTTRWRRRRAIIVCMYRRRSAMRHSTIIHDTQRFLGTTQPPQTSRHAARLSRRIAVPTSPSLFSSVAYGSLSSRDESIYMYVCDSRCRSTTKKSASG